jgi:hypothetical protein
MITQTTPNPIIYFGEELYSAFGLDDTPKEFQQTFLTNVTELILESAALRYLGAIDDEEQSVFVSWLQSHQHDRDFLSLLGRHYPEFMTILEEEVIKFKRDAFALVDGNDNPQAN